MAQNPQLRYLLGGLINTINGLGRTLRLKPKPLPTGVLHRGFLDGGRMRPLIARLFTFLAFAAAVAAVQAAEPRVDDASYTVKAGDTLPVAVWKEPDLTSNA